MPYTLLIVLDYFLLAFHLIFTLFNISGWIWRRTRKIHLVTMLLTLASWFGAGYWLGWGYCFYTDWHWQVREMLGNPIMSDSYTHFFVNEITGLDLPNQPLNNAIIIVFFVSLLLTIYLNISDLIIYRRYKRKNKDLF
ncbi:MAG: hypothetical protein A2W91_18575 [Bacteroidetes bacterium GWF2_38_335]|nr:MAG: hypothetical protein A2W91_18575 [Bacteroidetes bacterium GWF2_38_335]OFY78190.1 MAG: hypothetical protein A2281_04490 [Bacteroidetes bacterium RIFOXYA12_FULL_38_20]HBS88647.1 DUF2784 domain-containing protein [Bacteroidales bacterium]